MHNARRIISHRWSNISGNVRGGLLVVIASLLVAIMASLVKHIGQDFAVTQILFIRQIIVTLIISPVIFKYRTTVFKSKHKRIYFMRVVFSAIAMITGFTAVVHMPLAEVTAISFGRTLFATLLAIFILKEIVGIRRWAGTLIGFAGVLVIIRPDANSIDIYAILAIVSAFFVSTNMIILRKMTQSQTVKYHLIHFTSTTMKKYHDNRTPLVQKWPVLGRLLPMGFNWRICLLAVLTLKEQLPLTAIGEENALDDVQKLSDWILAHQKIEIHRMECYRKIYALAVKFGMITNVDSTGDRLVSMTMVTKDMIEKICVEKRSDPAYKELFFHSPSSLKPQNWNGQIKPHNWNPRMHPSSPAHREIDQNWGSFDKKDIPTNVVMSLGIACEELMPLAKRSMSDSAIEIDPSHLGK